jgi:hypothetical protein
MPSIPKLLLRALKPFASTVGLKAATLIRSTPGARTPGLIASGTNPTVTTYPCQALIEVLTVNNVPATLVQMDDRKIGILGASLPPGILPTSTDRVSLLDVDGVSKTFRLVAPISGDGVGAMFEFMARK